MKNLPPCRFVLIASTGKSILHFRGEFLKALHKLGFDIHVVAPEFDTSTRNALRNLGIIEHTVPMNRVGTNPLADFWTLFQLYRLLRTLKPCRVFSYTIKPVIYGSLAASLNRIPHIYALITGLGYSFQENSVSHNWLTRLVTLLYKLALRKSDRVFFQNPDDLQLFHQLDILKASQKSVIVNGSGVDTSYYSYIHPVRCRLDVHFLFIGRLLKDKGIREYVAAARIVKKNYSNVYFSIVGRLDDNPASVTKGELQSWIDEELIIYHGQQNDVRPYLANCDVYVLPSYREGTPRSVLEAMATGRAIITTDVPGCRETVIDTYNGYLVPARSPSAIAEAMIRFLAKKELIIEFGLHSRRIAEDKYDVHKVNNFMLQELQLIDKL